MKVIFKTFLVASWLLAIAFGTQAQSNAPQAPNQTPNQAPNQAPNALATSPTKAQARLVYALSNAQIEAIYKGRQALNHPSHFGQPVDTLSNTFPLNQLPYGHYLVLSVNQNLLTTTLHTSAPLVVVPLSNHNRPTLALTTLQGQGIANATVGTRRKTWAYNPAIRAYQGPNGSKAPLVKVSWQGSTHYFSVTTQKHQKERQALNFPLLSFLAYVGSTDVEPILGHIYHSLRWGNFYRLTYLREYHPLFRGYTYTNLAQAMASKYQLSPKSYMVLDKPQYRMGDTVRVKVYATNSFGRPRRGALKLSYYQQGRQKLITQSKPLHPGSYTFEWVLPSKLRQNQSYSLHAQHRGRNLSQNSFYLGDYALDKITYHARAAQQEFRTDEPVTVLLSSKDVNNLPVYGVRAKLTVSWNKVGPAPQEVPYQLIPNTLWEHTLPLDALGETEVVLPDSIFPTNTWTTAQVHVRFLNQADGATQTLQVHRKANNQHLQLLRQGDSLVAGYYEGTTPVPITAFLVQHQTRLSVQQPQQAMVIDSLQLPARLPLNPLTSQYTLQVKKGENILNTSYSPANSAAPLPFTVTYSGGQVLLNMQNPDSMGCWYSVIKHNTVLASGFTKGNWQKSLPRLKGPYLVTLNYLWGGSLHTQTHPIHRQAKNLTLAVETPKQVFPGQKVPVTVTVTNSKGKPVRGADLTAWAITQEFQRQNIPTLQNWWEVEPSTGPASTYTLKSENQSGSQTKGLLQWNKWSQAFGLDSLAYYRFTWPRDTLQRYSHPITPQNGSIRREVAPYVVKDGHLLPLAYVLINGKPVWFQGSTTKTPYSFPLNRGYHTITLRTSKLLITLDSVAVGQNERTLLSIDPTHPPRQHVTIVPMGFSYTESERQMLSRYYMPMQRAWAGRSKIIQGSTQLPLNKRSNSHIIGPLIQNSQFTLSTPKGHMRMRYSPYFRYVVEWPMVYLYQNQGYPSPFNAGVTAPAWQPDTVALQPKHLAKWLAASPAPDPMAYFFLPITEYVNTFTGNGRVQVSLPDSVLKHYANAQLLLFRQDSSTPLRGALLNTKEQFARINNVPPANYQLLVILENEAAIYYQDSLPVAANTLTNVNLAHLPLQQARQLPLQVKQLLLEYNSLKASSPQSKRNTQPSNNPESWTWSATSQSTVSRPTGSLLVRGQVLEQSTREPLPGVNVGIKGTSTGTVTDINGQFTLWTNPGEELVFNFIGFTPQTHVVSMGTVLEIELEEDVQTLNEVVITAMGTATSPNFNKANKATTAPAPPPEAAMDSMLQALMAQPSLSSSLRKNFNDRAFWQPTLLTNKAGQANFTVTYPDDITGWKGHYIAMGRSGHYGYTSSSTSAFKPLSSSLHLPRFMVAGDSVYAIGKISHYGSGQLAINTAWSNAQGTLKESPVAITHTHVDSLLSIAPARQDSLTLRYGLHYADAYQDAEERSIPLRRQGMEREEGTIGWLEGDTTLTFGADTLQGQGTLVLYGPTRNLLMSQANRTIYYHYNCNEQMASKLTALMAKQVIAEASGERFKQKATATKLIGLLMAHQLPNGTWPWWGGKGETSYWITTHVARALHMAQQNGYVFNWTPDKVIAHLIPQLPQQSTQSRLASLQLLFELGAKLNYAAEVDSIEAMAMRNRHTTAGYTALQLMRLRQEAGLPYSVDSLVSVARQDMLGQVYWNGGYRYYHVQYNQRMTTALAYAILRDHGGHPSLLGNAKRYLYTTNHGGYWYNTYESARLLMLFLPEIVEEKKAGNFSVTLTGPGGEAQQITAFPHTVTLNTGAAQYTVQKTGAAPLIYSAYQSHWEAEPEARTDKFTVTTRFTNEAGRTINQLQNNEPITLTATVHVKEKAEYVMIELPIPAGCTYENNEPVQRWGVHREHLRHQANFYYTKMDPGFYTLQVKLVPRFTGSFTVNPAKASLMYFPMIHGNNTRSRTTIH